MSHELGQPLPAGRGSGGAESSATRRDDDTEPSAPGGNPGGGAGLQQVEPAEAAAPTPMPAASGRPEASRSLYIGKLHPSVNEARLLENARAFVDAIQRARPAGAKGTYLKKAAVSSSMGPGVKIDVASLTATA